MSITALIIKYIGIYSPIIPLVLGWRKFNKVLWWYIIAGLLTDLTISLILKPFGFNRAWASNVYILIDYLLLVWYQKQHLKIIKPVYLNSFIAITSLVILALILSNSIFEWNSIAITIANFISILFGVAGLYIMLQEQKVERLQTSEYFWANVSFIIYYSGCFMLFLFAKHLETTDRDLLVFLWVYLLGSMNILNRLILTIAITRKKP